MSLPFAATFALLLILPTIHGGAEPASQARARQLTQQAATLVEERQYDQALALLREAQEAAPDYAPVQEWLAHIYEILGDKPQALNHIAALLMLQPNNDYGQEAVKRLFYHPPFPRVLNSATLGLSPLKITYDNGCVLTDERVPGFPQQYALCYTTSLKYPEDGTDGGPIVERVLPGPERLQARFNRVVYGYRELPDSGELRLRVITYYPSRLLSGAEKDLDPQAQAFTHLLLRFQGYAEGYLGLPDQGDAEGITRLWLCLEGSGGAERQGSDIFLYGALSETRSGVEWIRQLAHEVGHLLIPGIGGFAAPEMWANGEVGERLFLYWLAEEAGIWAGTPWPSDAATARLHNLWPEGDLNVEDYLALAGRAPLLIWSQEGPESELIIGMDERAMHYYVGFVLYILAAHGADGLRDVMNTCVGTTVADFMYAYRQAVTTWAQNGPLKIGVGALNPVTSKLTHPSPPASLTPRSLTLAPGDSVNYLVFLPRGVWRVWPTIRETGAKLLLSFDGSPNAAVDLQPGAPPIPIGPLHEGWHKLVLQVPAAEGILNLEGLVFSQGPIA
ncbi:MAG: tetratricopeptide repeat protein [Candidatus Zipacnadales bacterium]